MEENVVEKSRSIHAVFAWLWLVAGADLLWENNIADWLVVAGANLVWENNTAGWLADKPNEQSE